MADLEYWMKLTHISQSLQASYLTVVAVAATYLHVRSKVDDLAVWPLRLICLARTVVLPTSLMVGILYWFVHNPDGWSPIDFLFDQHGPTHFLPVLLDAGLARQPYYLADGVGIVLACAMYIAFLVVLWFTLHVSPYAVANLDNPIQAITLFMGCQFVLAPGMHLLCWKFLHHQNEAPEECKKLIASEP